jgi:hypothetical protein
MDEAKHEKFMGTFFDRDIVIKLSRTGEILSWIVVGVYTVDVLLAILSLILQYLRGYMMGVGVTDLATNIVYVLERPFRGFVYFMALQAIAKILLILLDMEDNTRRIARK